MTNAKDWDPGLTLLGGPLTHLEVLITLEDLYSLLGTEIFQYTKAQVWDITHNQGPS